MPSAAALRLQIEHALQTRIPGALTPRPRIQRDVASSGIPELNALLEGGFPIGAISELVGPLSSGRTTLAMATLAEMTQGGKSVAWVDSSDALDPESAAAAGVDLSRQLWVRCGPGPVSSAATPLQAAPSNGAAWLSESNRTPASSRGCGSPHPRGEARGLSQAVDAFLQPDVFSRPAPPRNPAVSRRNRQIGTPGAPNRKLLDRIPQDPRPIPRRAKDREEQIPTDRRPNRRQVLHGQRYPLADPRRLQAAQIANTAAAADARSQAGHWTENRNNAAGRAFATPPNAIAAGLPRFREQEGHAKGEGAAAERWKPSLTTLHRCTPPGEDLLAGKAPVSAESVPKPVINAVWPRKTLTKPHTSLAGERPAHLTRSASPLWRALDQALRATDLLLAGGGFSAIVLDLGGIPPEFAWRIPLTTWFRFRAAADRARTVLLVLTQHACARSSAELVLRLSPTRARAATTVLSGALFEVSVDRRRFEAEPPPLVQPTAAAEPGKLHLVSARKQPQRERAATWQRATSWTGTAGPSTSSFPLPSFTAPQSHD